MKTYAWNKKLKESLYAPTDMTVYSRCLQDGKSVKYTLVQALRPIGDVEL